MANLGESAGRARKTEFLAALLEMAPDEQVFDAKPPVEQPKIEPAAKLLEEPAPEAEPPPAPQPPTRSLGWGEQPLAADHSLAELPAAKPLAQSDADALEPSRAFGHPAHAAFAEPLEAEPEPTPATEHEEPEPLNLAQSVAWAGQIPAVPDPQQTRPHEEPEIHEPDETADDSSAPIVSCEPPPLPKPVADAPAPLEFLSSFAGQSEPEMLEAPPQLTVSDDAEDQPAALSEPSSDLPLSAAPAPRSASWADAMEPPAPVQEADEPKSGAGKLDWLKGLGRKMGLSKSAGPEADAEAEPERETWTLEAPQEVPVVESAVPMVEVGDPIAADEAGAAAEAPALAEKAGNDFTYQEAPLPEPAPAFDWLKNVGPTAEAHDEPAQSEAESETIKPERQPQAVPPPVMALNWLSNAPVNQEPTAHDAPEIHSEAPSALPDEELNQAAVPAPAPEPVAEEEVEGGLADHFDVLPDPADSAETATEPPKFDWSKVAAAIDAPAPEGPEVGSLPPMEAELASMADIDAPPPMAASPFVRSEPEPEPTHVAAMEWEEPEPVQPPPLFLAGPEIEEEPEPIVPTAFEPVVPEIFESADAPSLNADQAGMAKSYRWKRLGDLLVDLAVITPEQLSEALQLQKVGKKPLGQTLVENGFITEALLLKTLAAQYDVELWELESAEPSAVVARMLPEALCRERCMIAVERREDGIVVAMKNPADLEGLEEVQRITGMEAIPALASAERIEAYISEIFNPIAQMKAMQEKSGIEVTGDQDFDVRVEPDGSVVQMVDELLEMAIKMKVSDVHIEPREKMVEVRVRLDGQLIKIKEYSKAIAPMLTARFKIMAEVDLVEWRIPQDGRISIKCDGRVVDMRVSILPSLYGQRIVMRLLDKSNALRKLDELGFSQHNLVLFRKLINRPYGLFLVTGPTGSGKTTTLYAALNEIRKPTNNVMTCEDPVEYDIHGINQSQVNEKVGLTFGSQLRAILRQDPDIVLVGEIRDRETAEIAIKASMTGHMVLSTLHTNDAPGALPRLLDMGVDASNLSTALVGAMGQRLIRRLCPNCREDSAPTPDEIELLENSFGSTDLAKLWRPVGCPKCHGQGYKGRMAIHEIMPVTSESAELVQQRAPIERIREVVRYYGYRTMQEDSLDRIVNGVTSLDEAKRILSFDDVPRLENPEAYYKKLQKSA